MGDPTNPIDEPDSLAGIPDLLRRCSPVVLLANWQWQPAGSRGIVLDILTDKSTPRVDLACGGMDGACKMRELVLDLDDETGRAHAAVYCASTGPLFELADMAVLNCALGYTPCDVDRLRELVLMAAKRRKEADRG
jgi:hypothetical protein